MEQPNRFTLPAIVSDIDGVIHRHKQVLGNSPAALRKVLTPLPNGVNIPFTFVTNGGGFTEEAKAEQVNNRLSMEADIRVSESHMIECHTPLRQRELVDQFRDKYVLVIGCDDTLNVAYSYGYSKAIALDEVVALYPQAVPLELNSYSKDYLESLQQVVSKRFGKSVEDLQKDIKFAAIMHMNYTLNLGAAVQISSDLIGSKDGHITGPRRLPTDPQVIKVYGTNPDLVFVNQWPVARYGPNYYFQTLQHLLKEFYKVDLEFTNFGKPEISTYNYAESLLRSKAESQGIEISNFYMIGDNPASDIQGAIRKGWISILVRTGVWQGEENDAQYPATYVVNDFEEAIELIFRLEGL